MRPLAILAAAALLAWLWRRRPEPRDESRCDRCGGRNPASWHAPSPLWNAVMRADGTERYGFCCPTCFIELANERVTAGRAGASWCVRIHDDIGLPTVFGDGRTWDSERCMWVDEPMDGVQPPDPVTTERWYLSVAPVTGGSWTVKTSDIPPSAFASRLPMGTYSSSDGSKPSYVDPTYIEAREVAIRRGGQPSDRSLGGT